MDRHGFGVLDWPQLIYRRADHVHHPSESAATYGDGNRPALVDSFHAAHHALSRFHGNATYAPFAEMLLYFQDHIDRIRHGEAVANHLQRLINRRHGAFSKLHIHRRTGNFCHTSNFFRHKFKLSVFRLSTFSSQHRRLALGIRSFERTRCSGHKLAPNVNRQVLPTALLLHSQFQ